MATVAELLVKIGADSSGLRKELAASQRQMKRAFGSEALEASGTAAGILTAFAAAMGIAGAASVKMAGDMAVQKKSFEVLLGSASAAEEMMKDLTQFAADTPFELPGLVNASKKLLAMKFAAADIIPIMGAVGDAVSLMGGGQEAIDGVVRAIGQIQAKGKLSAEEINQLAERNINAWQYVAAELGVTVPEAMKMTEDGAVNATTAINGIVKGMQTEFAGGMASLSKEIPGLFSTIKDNAASVMREMGDKISTSLDVKGVMQNLANSLGSFATYVQQSGINQALKDLVPKELTLAIFAVSGALIGAAAPAMVVFATAVWAAIAPLLPFIAYGAALGATAWVIWEAWEPLGQLFSQTWAAALATTQTAWANIIRVVLSGVQMVLGGLGKLASFFNADWGATVSGWASSMQGAIDEAASEADNAATRMEIAGNSIEAAWGNTKTAVLGGASTIVDSAQKIKKAFTGLTNTGTPAGDIGGGKAAAAAEKEWEKLENKAKQVSESIEREWVQLTYSQIEQLNKWRVDEIKALAESATANANYVRDKQRVEETYAARKKKIDEEELNRQSQLKRTAQDIMSSYNNKTMSIGVTGVDKQVLDLKAGMDKEISSVTRTYEDMVKEFATLDTTAKANNIKTWKEAGLAFKANEDGTISFAEQAEKEKLAIRKDYAAQAKQLHYDRVKYEESLDEAHRDGNIAAFATQLSSEQALLAQDLSGRQEMIDVYYQVWQDSHRTAVSYMAEAAQGLYGGMTTMFTGLLDGTKSLSDAWAGLGKAVVGVIAQMAAQWIASQIMMAIFGKGQGAAQIAMAGATGAAVAAAWAPAAAMVSLATLGENALPAMEAITLTTGMAVSQAAIPALASGGITTGPSLALIGEGRYDEAVLPLNKKMFEKMGLTGGDEQRAGDLYHFTISGNDGPSIRKMIMEEGATIVKSLKKQARGFNVPEVSL